MIKNDVFAIAAAVIEISGLSYIEQKQGHVHLVTCKGRETYAEFKYNPKVIHSEYYIDEEGKGQEFDEANCIFY